jgi:hypothetical protein
MQIKLILAGLMMTTAAPVLAQTAYTNQASFNAAATGVPLTSQSFEDAVATSPTAVDFGNVSVNCSGSSYCPGFFGRSSALVTDGNFSVFFASPDTATFTFDSAINAFGIDVIGLGDVGSTNFFLNVGSGPLALQQNYSAAESTVTFAGVTSTTAFTSVTFSGSRVGDGIFFDRLRFGTSAIPAVPEPATWAMMFVGFGMMGASMRYRRRSTKVVHA